MALPREAAKELKSVVGEENFTESKTMCEAYSRGGYGKFSWDKNRKIPGCVILPSSTEEVQAIVKIANRYKLPYIPLGTFFIALCVPLKPNTIMIDMKRMDRIEIDEENMYALVDPYVTYTELQTEAMKRGLYTSAPSCGAQVAVIANHLNQGMGQLVHRVGYANRRVLAAEWILPDGELMKTGSASMVNDYFWGEGPGPDLRGIMRGWFGNFGGLGIVTKMAVKLFRLPFRGVPEAVGVSPNTAFALPEERFKWFTTFYPTTDQAINSMYEVGKAEIAAVCVRVPFIWRYIARAKSRDDFHARWETDKHKFGASTPSMVRVMLVGFTSKKQLEYEERVLKDIVAENGGTIEDATPFSSGQVFKLGISSNVTVPAGFFAVTKFAFDSFDHAKRALAETTDLKAKVIPPFFNDSEESGWMQSYDMGHIGYGEYFSYFDKSMVDKFMEYEVDSIKHDIKMGAYPGAQWSHLHEHIGPATGNYHLLMEKLGRSFDPNHVSNPPRLAPSRDKKKQ